MTDFVVTTAEDEVADNGLLSLREAVAAAARDGGTVAFAEGITGVNLSREIEIEFGRVIVDGDTDGDGIADVYLNTDAHHFTVGDGAVVTLRDLELFGGSKFAAAGDRGESGPQVAEPAADGLDGETVVADPIPDDVKGEDAIRAADRARIEKAAGELALARLDGLPGQAGADGVDGAIGQNGETAAGSIENFGDLTLERVGFYANNAFGGNGGDGGTGGRGAAGGKGGDGARGRWEWPGRDFEFVDPRNRDGGDGGRGGNGGDGGDGGAGGRGGDAAAAVLNYGSGTVKLIDVAVGGRTPFGSLTDQFGMTARAGDGGQGGNGGVAGIAGLGGRGGDDAITKWPVGERAAVDQSLRTGDVYQYYNRGGGTSDPLLFYRTWQDGTYREWLAQAEVVRLETTAGGTGGGGGSGGSGGSGGANGGGGNAAMIVNYGTITGNLARGTANEAEAGFGGKDDLLFTVSEGQDGRSGEEGNVGGDEQRDWRTFDLSHEGEPVVNQLTGTFIKSSSGRFIEERVLRPNPADTWDGPPNAQSGGRGADGENGEDGALGKLGQARSGVYSDGSASVEEADGLVYLTGLRQSDDLTKLLFSIVRVGDTSDEVTVRYSLAPGEGNSAGREDFSDLRQARGEVTFAAIDQGASTFDASGAGVHHVEIDIAADGLSEAPETFGVRLFSDGATLGTSRLSGTLLDADVAVTVIDGSAEDDRDLEGTSGDDLIRGFDGSDRLDGRNGNDILQGGAGDDLLRGGAGDDTLTGGEGADTFLFTGARGDNVVTDFEDGDTLLLDVPEGITAQDLLPFVSVTGNGVLLEAGGFSLLLEGTTSLRGLADDVELM
ncbi:hypothetical protein [Jannaschia formosa]|uniref:hypothetical protein n=1 Tax=Jannaschia formosa TaxID=2259592 RepID=UPI000E1BFDDD|nr:hypothetical protein [Jannaschia formosa]TFL18381.1 hypothetical protein DR046_09825 [Jannaschia formosa]